MQTQTLFESSTVLVTESRHLISQHEELVRVGFEVHTGMSVRIIPTASKMLQVRTGDRDIFVVIRAINDSEVEIEYGQDLRSPRKASIRRTDENGVVSFVEDLPTHFIRAPFGFYPAVWCGVSAETRKLVPRLQGQFNRCAELVGLSPDQAFEKSRILSTTS